MANYNYYNNLVNRFSKETSTKKQYDTGLFDKSADRGYNENAKFKMQNDGMATYQWYDGTPDIVGQGLAPAVSRNNNSAGVNHNSSVYSGRQRYGEKTAQPLIRQSSADTFSTREKAMPDISTDAFKKKAQNQWYNKIAHGSFKDDNWFDSMVKNQENAENWYKTIFGEKQGKKEYNTLHNRLVNTPYDKIKEEEKQFANYKTSDFKVPEIQPVKYSYNGNGSKGELNREKAKETRWTAKFVDWIRSIGQEYQKAKLVEHEADYTAQKNIQRNVWKLGAQYFLRDYKGCYTSAWMLEHSLQDNPEDIYRGNDSRIAYLINHDDVYLSKLDEAIRNSKNGVIDQDLEEIKFTDDDLYYSIHKADIHVKGYKQENGKWIIKATLSDTYDFTEIQTFMDDNGGWSSQAGLGTVANDVATGSQLLGAINPYKVTVEFYTTR